jgi:hypothetical protein
LGGIVDEKEEGERGRETGGGRQEEGGRDKLI